MIIKKIYIEKNEASCEEICSFIHEVDKDFITPISMKVDIENYSIKVKNNADIYTIKCNGRVIAMGICYTNDIKNGIAYLSFFAVSKENRKWGGVCTNVIARNYKWIKRYFDDCRSITYRKCCS